MKDRLRVPVEKLKRRGDDIPFDFVTTEEIPVEEGFIGQERARRALEFGLRIRGPGYNIYMAGPPGTGRTTFARKMAEEVGKNGPVPCDWVYVHNFKDREKPKAIALPPGKGLELREAMRNMIEELKKEIPRVFAGEEFEKLKGRVLEEFYAHTNELYQELEEFARQEQFAISKTATGLASVPLVNGQPVSQEEYENLPEEVKEDIQIRNRRVQEKMNETMRRYRELERRTKAIISDLERQVGRAAIEPLLKEVQKRFEEYPQVLEYLKEVEEDLIDNLDIFTEKEEPQNPMVFFRRFNRMSIFSRYQVNLLVDNSQTTGQPVIEERNPTFSRLFGAIEYEGEFGVLSTDFTKLKRGAIHAANGGYLILQAADLLKSPLVWDTLKRTLRNREGVIESIFRNLNLGGAVTLEPEPIPIDLKVILIGDQYLYHLLYQYDEDFRKLFKIKVDFDTETTRSEETAKQYAAFVAATCRRHNLPPFDREAVARIIEFSSRLAEDQLKMSTFFSRIEEIVIEAAAWAMKEGAKVIGAEFVEQAIRERDYRSNRLEMRLHEAILDGTIMIDTEGKVVGQVNGLGVYALGDYIFGRPSRITARTYLGEKGVINIERESRLSGQIHDKGVLTLSGYLGGQYAQDKPLTLSASLGFEQLYGIIEGDSASSAELFALLSSLSGLPIDQGIAVTGSVNQQGEIQPVGGVNYKIEGFFKVCKDRGLTGTQGVIIPRQNVRHLMLSDEVIEAVRQNKFHIWAISHVDEGIEILTGVPAGKRQKNGRFPVGTVHYLVDRRLKEWGRRRRPKDKDDEEKNKMGKSNRGRRRKADES